MRIRIAKFSFVAVCLSAMVAPGIAADRTETVKFSPGATSATTTGSLKGYDGVNYLLGAREGQAISILFQAKNNSCYFNFFGPGGDEALFNGSSSGNEYAANLPTSGSYRAQVYLMRNAARGDEVCQYTITFEISG